MVLQLVLVLQPELPVKINIQVTSLLDLSREDRYDCNRFVTVLQAVNLANFPDLGSLRLDFPLRGVYTIGNYTLGVVQWTRSPY